MIIVDIRFFVKIFITASWRQADILLAKQAGGQDRCRAVLRELITAFQLEGGNSVKILIIKADFSHATNDHPTAFDRGAYLEPATMIAGGMHAISRRKGKAAEIPCAQGQKCQRNQPDKNKYTHPKSCFAL